MTRFLRQAVPIQVDVDAAGQPQCFTWQGKAHPVERSTRWRVDSDWWAARIWRDYHLVSTTSGKLVILYQDLIDGTWWFQRLYD